MPHYSTGSLPRSDTSCPTCGARADSDQLVCLECGSRVALDYRRPPSWRVPVVILVGVLLLAAAGTALALKSIGDDAEREVSRTPINVKGGKGAGSGAAAGKTPKASAEKKPATEGAAGTGLVQRGALYSWPPDLKAFTVVLLSTEDRASADSFARSAAEGRPAKIGVIRADDFESLPKGQFVVFAGQYENRDAAVRAADRLEERFSGSVPQLVEG